MTLFVGYVPVGQLPLKPGDTITIRKGLLIRTTIPDKQGKGYIQKFARRTYKVKVNHILNGTDQHLTPPSVRWAGTGGYWHEVSINDVPEAVKSLAYDGDSRTCTCGKVYTVEAWKKLDYLGIQLIGPSDGPDDETPGFMELRVCPSCNTTMAFDLTETWPEHLR